MLGTQPDVGAHGRTTSDPDSPQQYTHVFRQVAYGAKFTCEACRMSTVRYNEGSTYELFDGQEPEWVKWAQRRNGRR